MCRPFSEVDDDVLGSGARLNSARREKVIYDMQVMYVSLI